MNISSHLKLIQQMYFQNEHFWQLLSQELQVNALSFLIRKERDCASTEERPALNRSLN